MDGFVLVLARVVHVVGIVLWIGGLIALAAIVASGTKELGRGLASAARKAALVVVTPGLLLAWLGGLGMLLPYWSTIYARAGWMHGKLTIGLIVAGLSGMLTGRLRRIAGGQGEPVASGMLGIAVTTLVLMVVAVALVFIRPGTR